MSIVLVNSQTAEKQQRMEMDSPSLISMYSCISLTYLPVQVSQTTIQSYRKRTRKRTYQQRQGPTVRRRRVHIRKDKTTKHRLSLLSLNIKHRASRHIPHSHFALYHHGTSRPTIPHDTSSDQHCKPIAASKANRSRITIIRPYFRLG